MVSNILLGLSRHTDVYLKNSISKPVQIQPIRTAAMRHIVIQGDYEDHVHSLNESSYSELFISSVGDEDGYNHKIAKIKFPVM